MNTYTIRRRGGWANAAELELAASRSSQAGLEMAPRVRWLRTYVVEEPDGRFGTVCIYQGVDEEAIIEHARRAELPSDEITLVLETLVINEDSVAA